ncbi:amidase domain-containing protein [Paenibacillus sp. GCM10027629]|uniref:amidase domain-containing protein n=1 Tax=Paenibacillus sp. GCM10027629 TaxID=3273414 RepID=UPI0036D38C88
MEPRKMVAISDEERNVTSFLNELYALRANLLIHNHQVQIEQHYVHGHKASDYAMRQELKRAEYIHTWGEKRGIRFIDAKSDIRITRIQFDGDLARISLVQSLKLSYFYLQSYAPSQSFGIGTRHALTLKKNGHGWLLYKEWYLDPLEENPKLIPITSDGSALPFVPNHQDIPSGSKYNRKRAIAYANKYAGIAWGAGNRHRYNRSYKDYTTVGGDCTNFASQVIGDPKEGGGLPMTSKWRYLYGKEGSESWIRTDSFHQFLIRSGYGKMIASGLFSDIVKPTEKFPHGAVSQLLPGDLIGFVMHGDVDHFSVVVGYDNQGYPLVNSHTADRYRVPFDLGWDRHTKYILIHIRD